MEWFAQNWLALLVIAMVASRAIVGLTKTEADDKVVRWLINAVRAIFGVDIPEE